MGTITWRKAGVYVLVALPVLGLAGIAVIARQQQDAAPQSTGDPVADAARKARQQKKEAPKPKKVYTNEDVSSAPADSATSATATPATKAENAAKASQAEAAAASPATDTEKTEKTAKTEKNDEATWRKRFKEARDKLAVAEKELDILQREANKALTQYYSDPAKAMTEQQNRTYIKEHDAQITAKKQEVAQLKQQISDLEDDLRRSGGDIGWARE
jgi:hypothetical protein